VVAAALCASLTAAGERVAAFKPAVTGLDEPPGEWPPDHALLATAAGGRQSPEDVAPLRFGPAVSPHYAAELSGTRIEPADLADTARAAADGADVLVCEGVGGLLVPLTTGYAVRDFALDLGLPVVVAARPGLGTINLTLLTLESARAAGLSVAGVVMTPWSDDASDLEESNRATVERLGDVIVSTLPYTSPRELAAAGAGLPLEAWLG
jgi:dethiobiotin synthetase